MKEVVESRGCVRFGPFEADLQVRELRRNGRPIKLQDQPFQILILLLAHAGEVVSREAIEKQLWPPNTFVDFEHSIATAIKKLRLALGDDAGTRRYVETVPRRGYRFIAPVELVERAEAQGFDLGRFSESATVEPATQDGGKGAGSELISLPLRERLRRAPRRTLWAFSLGVLSVTMIAFLSYRRFAAGPSGPSGPVRIAVLPFLNLSGDPQQEYFSDGMTEALITELGRFASLRVISRTSAMHYKGTGKTLPEIARELNADVILEGSVIRSGNKVRITAQLLDAKRDQHTWASTYERNQRDIFALQDEFAHDIAREIGARLIPGGETRSPTRSVSPEAFQSYLKGQYNYNKRTEGGVQAALRDFEAATKDDPNFAPAYAGVATCYMDLGDNTLPMREAIVPARAAANRALQLDPDWPQTHTALALLELAEWRWSSAEQEFKRALELNPADAVTNLEYAVYLADLGRLDDATRQFQRALETDPLNVPLTSAAALPSYYARHYPQALEQYRRALAMDPGDLRAVERTGLAFALSGDYPHAVVELDKARAMEDAPELTGLLGYVYGRWGRPSDVARALGQLKAKSQSRFVSPADIVPAYIGLGNNDEAFRLLTQACDDHSDTLRALKMDPIFEPLRSDPRYSELERRIGLLPEGQAEGSPQ